ncbi:unnamed protein product [Sphagnum tenellum]
MEMKPPPLMAVSKACCKPAPPALQISIEGKEESMAGLSVYVVGSFTASAAIILVSDVFGWMTPQLRKLADKAAAAGYLAIVPDYMHGDPFKPSPEGGRAGFAEWIVKHHPEGGVEVTKEMVKIIKSKGISAVGLAGFCWGSKVAALVGKEPNIVEAIVQLHPSLVQASDYEDVKAHIAVLAAPSDGVDKHADILSAHTQIDTFLKVFPNVKHGWTVKYDMDNHEEVAEAEAAHQMMFSWFDKYLIGNQVLSLRCPFNGNGSLTTSIPQVLSPYDLNSDGSVTTSTPEVLP